jgi:hypothetical protein
MTMDERMKAWVKYIQMRCGGDEDVRLNKIAADYWQLTLNEKEFSLNLALQKNAVAWLKQSLLFLYKTEDSSLSFERLYFIFQISSNIFFEVTVTKKPYFSKFIFHIRIVNNANKTWHITHARGEKLEVNMIKKIIGLERIENMEIISYLREVVDGISDLLKTKMPLERLELLYQYELEPFFKE